MFCVSNLEVQKTRMGCNRLDRRIIKILIQNYHGVWTWSQHQTKHDKVEALWFDRANAGRTVFETTDNH